MPMTTRERTRTTRAGARIGGLLLAVLAVVPAGGCGSSDEYPRTLLLVSIDTLRADRFGAYGSDLDLTPRMDELAAESVVFDTAFAPCSFTVPSLSSMLTGWYPEQNGILTNEHLLPRTAPTLASLLSDRGYRTGAVVSNFVLRAGAGLERDFDVYDDEMSMVETVRPIPERLAASTTTDALRVLDALRADDDEHVFLWVHYQDPHGPYTPPDDERAKHLERERARPDGQRELTLGRDHRGLGEIPDYQNFPGQREVAFYRAGYHAEVRICDREIGRLLDGLRERGLWEDAVVVLAADHGEGLGENDYWFAHGEYLTDPLVRVPFFVRAPGIAPGRRDDLAGLIDLVPTLAPMFGLVPPDGLPGRDLFSTGAETADHELYMATLLGSKLPRIGLVRDGYKYVATKHVPDRPPTEELFLLGVEDEDLAAREPARVAEMRARIKRILGEVKRTGEERRRQLTPEEREQMRKIGYADGGR